MIGKSLAQEIASTELSIRTRKEAINAYATSIRENLSGVVPVALTATGVILVVRSLFKRRAPARAIATAVPAKAGIDVFRLIQLGLTAAPAISELFHSRKVRSGTRRSDAAREQPSR